MSGTVSICGQLCSYWLASSIKSALQQRTMITNAPVR